MASQEQPIRLGIVISSKLLRYAFSSMAESAGYIIQCSYSDGQEMIDNLGKETLPDIIIIDIDKDLIKALVATVWLAEHHSSVRMLGLTLEPKEATIKPFIGCGATGYFLKQDAPNEIQKAIKTVLTKGFYIPPLNPWRRPGL